MGLGTHGVVGLGDLPGLVDQVRDAPRICRLGICRAICPPERLLRVAEQAKRKVKLLGKGGVVVYAVEAGTEDDDVALLKLAV
jgi:hypothetical protein